ncbi:MAG: L,D-transpeptidase [Spirulinaceae cyanobacterium SM2_1_0]|nr:L,D-transpeptidase [Spirulinaceae cyanobacterium SM2_1_0]
MTQAKAARRRQRQAASRRRRRVRQRRQAIAAFFLVLGSWLGCSTLTNWHAPPRLLNYDQPLTSLVATLPLEPSVTVLRVDKSDYRLTLYHEREPLKAYPVVFGPDPKQDKLYDGDGRTPEGEFTIRDRYLHPNWSRFLWLNYPTEQSRAKHRQAKQAGLIPITTIVGGDIAIHGVPENRDDLIEQRNNWTQGSIALKNRDIEELYQAVQIGATVIIVP